MRHFVKLLSIAALFIATPSFAATGAPWYYLLIQPNGTAVVVNPGFKSQTICVEAQSSDEKGLMAAGYSINQGAGTFAFTPCQPTSCENQTPFNHCP